jgi:hypothetical protein
MNADEIASSEKLRPVVMDGPVLVFGGPYSNLEATEAVLAEAARRGIPPARIVCTGDVVAYCADARATVERVREAGIHVVMGNCEEKLGAGAEDCGCGFAPGSACDRLAAEWFAHADRTLDADARRWMAQLPRRLDLLIAGLRLAVIHGGLEEISRFVFPSMPARVKALELKAAQCDGIVAGHCGIPFSQVIATAEGPRLWHNAGAAGMPANDGTARVWCSILTPGPEPRSLAIEHVALTYDAASAAEKMRTAGLVDYADALTTGLWPSCDVLPPAELKQQGKPVSPGMIVFRRDRIDETPFWPAPAVPPRLDPAKFRDPVTTAAGEKRARVALNGLDTLWINTGTLCNLTCAACYIESSPKNDRLVYVSAREVAAYLDEIERDGLGTRTIGFTGGEPFMNRELVAMLEDVLGRGFDALVLTNAMRPMARYKKELLALNARYGARLIIRVSLDHYTKALHELERGRRSWQPTVDGLTWLAAHGFTIHVAGRLYSGEAESIVRAGYQRFFDAHGIAIDASDPVIMTVFPEMDATADVPEITDACWGILGKNPADVMCASSRMVVKRKGAERPAVVACTLLPYDAAFELGPSLRDAMGSVPLNHPHCAKFCVLGGAACSR